MSEDTFDWDAGRTSAESTSPRATATTVYDNTDAAEVHANPFLVYNPEVHHERHRFIFPHIPGEMTPFTDIGDDILTELPGENECNVEVNETETLQKDDGDLKDLRWSFWCKRFSKLRQDKEGAAIFSDADLRDAIGVIQYNGLDEPLMRGREHFIHKRDADSSTPFSDIGDILLFELPTSTSDLEECRAALSQDTGNLHARHGFVRQRSSGSATPCSNVGGDLLLSDLILNTSCDHNNNHSPSIGPNAHLKLLQKDILSEMYLQGRRGDQSRQGSPSKRSQQGSPSKKSQQGSPSKRSIKEEERGRFASASPHKRVLMGGTA